MLVSGLRKKTMSFEKGVDNTVNENKTTQFLLRLSEKELNQIKDNAKACDKTVSAFIRENALNFCILNCDYQSIINHTREITSLRNAINQLVYTIKKTGEYVPADLEYILKKMNEISKSENQFLNLMLDEKEQKNKIVAREARKIVKAKLKDSKTKEQKHN